MGAAMHPDPRFFVCNSFAKKRGEKPPLKLIGNKSFHKSMPKTEQPPLWIDLISQYFQNEPIFRSNLGNITFLESSEPPLNNQLSKTNPFSMDGNLTNP